MLCRIFFSLLISLQDFFSSKKCRVYIYRMYLHLHCGYCSNSSNMELQSLKNGVSYTKSFLYSYMFYVLYMLLSIVMLLYCYMLSYVIQDIAKTLYFNRK